MAVLPIRNVRRQDMDAAIEQLVPRLGPDVVHLRWDMEPDWYGDPAIHFRVVLTDEASKRGALKQSAARVRDLVQKELDPFENWGMFPYFHFRSASEHAQLPEPAWL